MSAIDLEYDGDHDSLDDYDEFGNYDGSNIVVTAQKTKPRKNNVSSKWWSYSLNDLTIFHKFKDIDKERICQQRKLSIDEINSIKHEFTPVCWSLIFHHQDLTNEFINDNIENMDKESAMHLYNSNRFFSKRHYLGKYDDIHGWVRNNAKLISDLIPEHTRIVYEKPLTKIYLQPPIVNGISNYDMNKFQEPLLVICDDE